MAKKTDLFPNVFSHCAVLFFSRQVFSDYMLTFIFSHCVLQLKRCDVWNVTQRNLARIQRRPVPAGSATRTTQRTGKVTPGFLLSWRKDVILRGRIPLAYAALTVSLAVTSEQWLKRKRIDGSVSIIAVMIMMNVTVTCTPLQLVMQGACWIFKLWKN